MTAFACADINREALQHNLSVVRQLAPKSKVMAVIKANAYGHGIEQVAAVFDAADALGVARISEAMDVRYAGCDKPVVLLEGVMRPRELGIASMYNLEIVVHREDQVRALEEYSGVGRFYVWLKFDTGMNRLGFACDQVLSVMARLKKLKCVRQPMRLMSHFAAADNTHSDLTQKQLTVFERTVNALDAELSMANSAAVLNFSQSHFDWVRPGAMLYGISPLAGRTGEQLGLREAMTLWSRVIAVKDVRRGSSVGYAETWTAQRATRIAIVAVGYGDGYPWRLPSGAPVLINERSFPLAGRVSMDMIAVDIGHDARVGEGDKAILWGRGLPVETIAETAGTIPYELICGISKRVRVAMLER